MSLFSAQLYPHRALGFLTLGAFLHDIITRLKAEPQRFPKLNLLYSRQDPVKQPVMIELPANGLRLQFDGREQRLRLIEVMDFSKNHITYSNIDLVKPTNGLDVPSGPGDSSNGPTFRHIYNKFLGPTYNGEYIPAADGSENGVYVLSYPGVAFTFRLPQSSYSPEKDVVSLLSAASSQNAQSMAIFNGSSWAAARDVIWTEVLPSIKASTHLPRSKDVVPDEISLIRLHGGGKVQLFKKWTQSCLWISLGETTPQDLVAELGPPNAIYRKSDQRMTIHKQRTASHSHARGDVDDARFDDVIDTDQSIASSEGTYDDSNSDEIAAGNISGECFYNYFYLGFDVLVSSPKTPSPNPPRDAHSPIPPEKPFKSLVADRLVATKIILHGNIPGSYEFNRHRRIRWEVAYLYNPSLPVVNSEMPFKAIMSRMKERWMQALAPDQSPKWENGMVLNRGWGDSPGSSCELLGGWDEGSPENGTLGALADGRDDSTTTLFGLPGMVFEVLRNGYVNTVTVF